MHTPPARYHGALVALHWHDAAALYHQFVRRDSLLARMGWGARSARQGSR